MHLNDSTSRRYLSVKFFVCLLAVNLLRVSERLTFDFLGAETVMTTRKFERIDQLLSFFLNGTGTPGIAAAVIVNGEPVLSRTYGLLDHTDERSNVTTNSLFEIGSCTKAFTSYLIACLVREGLVSYEDPVIQHIPEFQLNDPDVTRNIHVKDLLSHSSGLPGHDSVFYHSSAGSRNELLAKIPHLELSYGLREKYQYNNIMYAVAGMVVERITNHSWEYEVRQRIFNPLKMTQSLVSYDEAKRLPSDADVAKGHTTERDSVRIALLPPEDITMVAPAGSIHSSLNDMLKWIQFQMSETVPKEMHVLKTPQMYDLFCDTSPDGHLDTSLGYGYGWRIALYRGQYVITHSGQTDGFSACVALFPEKKHAYVLLGNLDTIAFGLFGLVKRMDDIIANVALVESDEVWLSKLLASNQKSKNYVLSEEQVYRPEQYVGSYQHPGYGVVKVSVVEFELSATFNNIGYILKPEKKGGNFILLNQTLARTDGGHECECSFINDSSGQVIACRIGFEPALSPIVFEKQFSKEEDVKYLESFVGTFGHGTTCLQIRLNREKRLLITSGMPQYYPEKLKPLKLNRFSFGPSTLVFEFIHANEKVSELKVHQGVNVLYTLEKKGEK